MTYAVIDLFKEYHFLRPDLRRKATLLLGLVISVGGSAVSVVAEAIGDRGAVVTGLAVYGSLGVATLTQTGIAKHVWGHVVSLCWAGLDLAASLAYWAFMVLGVGLDSSYHEWVWKLIMAGQVLAHLYLIRVLVSPEFEQ